VSDECLVSMTRYPVGSSSSSALAAENNRLRKHLTELQTELRRLQTTTRTTTTTKTTASSTHHTIAPVPQATRKRSSSLRELATRRIPSLPKSWTGLVRHTNPAPVSTSNGHVKRQQSLAGYKGDQQSTVEPRLDLEAHESAGGLHHRDARGPDNRSDTHTTLGTNTSTNTTSTNATTSSTADHDDEEVAILVVLPEQHNDNEEEQSLVKDPTTSLSTDGLVRENRYETTGDSYFAQIKDRAGWLVGLLCLQSMSSFIISRNETLLQEHIVIVQFLTMLVGAGGNAGNQASVRVIRGLAVGSVNDSNVKEYLRGELWVAVTLMSILGLAGCVRAAIFLVPVAETIAITTSLCVIVMISIILGALLPLGMNSLRIDPAHSSTTIQVIMDILGVTITCHVSAAILDSRFHAWLTQDDL
jgi:hypothetical protein